MPTKPLDRRLFLRGSAAACFALPWLEAMGATPPAPARRLVYLYFPNGASSGSWAPAKIGEQNELHALHPTMAALEPWKKQLVLTRNLWTPRGNGHGAGTATWLTGGGYDGRRIDAGARSADLEAAAQVGQKDLLPSLQLSTRGEGYFSHSISRNNISWVNRALPASRLHEPRAIFDLMFLGGGTSKSWADRSVLDLVMGQARDLKRRVGSADKHKVDEYLESVRSVERRLEFAERDTSLRLRAGVATDTLERPEPGIPSSHEDYVRLMMDLLALALWSGATKVASFMLDHGQSNRYFDFIPGVKGTWHALSHYRDISGRTDDDDGKTSWISRESKQKMYDAVSTWHHAQLAYLLERLQSFGDEFGTLLDHTCVVYGSSLSDGHAHGRLNLPTLIAGGSKTGLRCGRFVDYKRNTSLSRLHLTMLQQLGAPVKRFAEADEPLTDLITG